MTSTKASSSQCKAPLYWFVLFAILFSLQILPRLSQDSPAGDEMVDIVDGFYYWQGDVISSAEHPPLAKALQALPSRFMGLESKSGMNFSGYTMRDGYFMNVLNRARFESILQSARVITYLFGLALGFALFAWARRESLFFILTVLTLWAFEPVLLAFSGFALAEIPLTLFFFLAVIQFQKLTQKPSVGQALLAGLLLGMAVTAKLTGLLLLPTFALLEIIAGLKTRFDLKAIVLRWAWGLTGAFLWVCLLYMPGTLAIVGHPSPISLFANALHAISNSFGFAYYFKGELSTQTHWDYFPTAFLLKSPLTFLFLLVMGGILGFWGKVKLPAWQWVPLLVFFAVFSFNHDMGLRMIMPVYPFCFLMAGRAGDWMAAQSTAKNHVFLLLWGGLLIFQGLSVVCCYPEQVSYFNELTSSDRRVYWLGGPNLDMGQDTKRLAKVAKARGWDHIKLAYAGSANPKIYGMNWNYWTRKDLQAPQTGWVYVINDDFIQTAPSNFADAGAIDNSWIMRLKPTGHVGDTWYYFEMPGKVQPDSSPKIQSTSVFIDDIYTSKIK